MRLLLLLIVSVGISFFAPLFATPTYVCQRTCEPITIDGVPDEPVWSRAQSFSSFRDLSGASTPIQPMVKMLYDDAALYLSAVIPSTNLRATKTERDSIIFHDDDFELFIDPTCTGRNYLELEVNALNTVWDLFLTAPYREGSACIALHDWDIKGLRSAVTLQGTLNDDRDEDTSWTVELALPWASITGHSHLPRRGEAPAPGTEMRVNLSCVDHPNGVPFGQEGYTERNNVWAPTRQATIHAPEHWGRVRFSEKAAGTPETFPPEVGLWVHGNAQDLSPELLAAWKRAGITTLIIDGTSERIAEIASWAKAQGLRTVAWVWTLNRPGDEIALAHPEWYAVSATGKSCHKEADRPFVSYYQFLCPHSEEVRAHLLSQVKALARCPAIDALQLDYIRMPDVVLPKALWPTYGLDMRDFLPEYAFCYCERCKQKALARVEASPETPTDEVNWQVRLEAVAEVANLLAEAVRAEGKPCGAAVFPTPRLARKMVYQAWDLFELDFAYPMTYASFYAEDNDWILTCVREAQETLTGRFPIYPGLHLPDFTPETLRTFLPELLKSHPEGFVLFSHETFTPGFQATLSDVLAH